MARRIEVRFQAASLASGRYWGAGAVDFYLRNDLPGSPGRSLSVPADRLPPVGMNPNNTPYLTPPAHFDFRPSDRRLTLVVAQRSVVQERGETRSHLNNTTFSQPRRTVVLAYASTSAFQTAYQALEVGKSLYVGRSRDFRGAGRELYINRLTPVLPPVQSGAVGWYAALRGAIASQLPFYNPSTLNTNYNWSGTDYWDYFAVHDAMADSFIYDDVTEIWAEYHHHNGLVDSAPLYAVVQQGASGFESKNTVDSVDGSPWRLASPYATSGGGSAFPDPWSAVTDDYVADNEEVYRWYDCVAPLSYGQVPSIKRYRMRGNFPPTAAVNAFVAAFAQLGPPPRGTLSEIRLILHFDPVPLAPLPYWWFDFPQLQRNPWPEFQPAQEQDEFQVQLGVIEENILRARKLFQSNDHILDGVLPEGSTVRTLANTYFDDHVTVAGVLTLRGLEFALDRVADVDRNNDVGWSVAQALDAWTDPLAGADQLDVNLAFVGLASLAVLYRLGGTRGVGAGKDVVKHGASAFDAADYLRLPQMLDVVMEGANRKQMVTLNAEIQQGVMELQKAKATFDESAAAIDAAFSEQLDALGVEDAVRAAVALHAERLSKVTIVNHGSQSFGLMLDYRRKRYQSLVDAYVFNRF